MKPVRNSLFVKVKYDRSYLHKFGKYRLVQLYPNVADILLRTRRLTDVMMINLICPEHYLDMKGKSKQ